MTNRQKLWTRIAIITAGALTVLTLAFAGFDWGLLKGTIESRLSSQLERQVTIERIERVDTFGLTPHLRLHGVRIANPDWAGKAPMLTVRQADVRVSILAGGAIRRADVRGLEADLLHLEDPRANWKFGDGGGKGGPLAFALTVADAKVRLTDLKRNLRLNAAVASDAKGLRIAGTGTLRGSPITLSLTGAAIDGVAVDAPYPFRAAIRSALTSLDVEGRMAGDFNTSQFTAKASSTGQNLEYLDDIILAGLPGTQAYKVSGTLRRDNPDWFIETMTGTIGRSTFSGPLSIKKDGEKTILDGDIRSTRFDFDDLASNAGKARAAARLARTGPRVAPYFEIDLSQMRDTSGRLGFIVDRLLLPPNSPFVGAKGIFRMDGGLLTAEPLTVTLRQGTIIGTARVDHRSGAPKFAVNVAIKGARLGHLLKGQADAPLTGHVRLSGSGRTIRDAIGRGEGEVVLLAQNGRVKKSTAEFLGENASAGLFADKGDTTALNCVVMRMRGRNGRFAADPLVIDTGVSRADVTGSVAMASEVLTMQVRGSSKKDRVIRLPAPIEVGGTLAAPEIGLAPVKGGLLGKIGRAIGLNDKTPDAPPADCAALAARVR